MDAQPVATASAPNPWWIAAAIGFVVAGALELLFFGLSILGTIVGGAMTAGYLADALPNEGWFVGPLLLVFYGLWFLSTMVAGPIHVVAGVAMLFRRAPRWLVWAATIASVVPVVTFYCAATSLIAGALGLVALLKDKPPA